MEKEGRLKNQGIMREVQNNKRYRLKGKSILESNEEKEEQFLTFEVETESIGSML